MALPPGPWRACRTSLLRVAGRPHGWPSSAPPAASARAIDLPCHPGRRPGCCGCTRCTRPGGERPAGDGGVLRRWSSLILAVLVIRDPWFGFFTPRRVLLRVRLLPWPWRLPGVAAVAVVAATSQTSGVRPGTRPSAWSSTPAVIAVNVMLACAASPGSPGQQRHAERASAARPGRAARGQPRLEATLAENAGLHEQLLAQAREAGILDERQRMAREIHDTLAQGLTGIITQLQAAEQAGRGSGRAGAGTSPPRPGWPGRA